MARGSRSVISAASRRRSSTCSTIFAASWSRTISSTIASSAPPLIFVGWTKPSRSSVVSGESESRGSAATKSAASLIAFTSCPFAVPGCVERPRIVTLTFAALNVSASISPGAAPSSV